MRDGLKILFAASEVAPFVKTGGLADVAGSLPVALKELGHDVRVVLPEYSQIPDKYRKGLKSLLHFRTMVSWRNEYVGVNEFDLDGLPVYFIDNKCFFHRETIYENNDRHLQFAYFCRGLLEMLPKIPFKPDIIHFNDWQTGPLALMLDDNYRRYEFYRNIKTVFTIHNLRFQGQFGPEIVNDVLGISPNYWKEGIIRHNGLVNYMKMGIMCSDIPTTVSKTYAEEIKYPYYGEGLDYAVRMRAADFAGIVNGISYDEFNPARDRRIYVNYDRDTLEKKVENKLLLQEELGLPPNKELPLIGIVSRLTEQKGFDLILETLDELLTRKLQLVLLGTGYDNYEKAFHRAAERYPDKMAAEIRYDSRLAQKIYAGSDLFLMPSRFEPCGLSQLISLRYGTIPVVRETGGLKDTICPYNEETGEGNGFSFFDYDGAELLKAVDRALQFYNRPEIWRKIIRQGMDCDFSWKRSAREYVNLYEELVQGRGKAESQQGGGISFEGMPAGTNEAGKGTDSRDMLEAGEANMPGKGTDSGDMLEAGEKVNINRAGLERLRSLKGIGPYLAEQIILYRDHTGGFNSREELLKIKGISKRKLNMIAEDFTL